MTPRALTGKDYAGVCRLLEASGLICTDLSPDQLKHFLGIKSAEDFMAVGGVELLGDCGLVRSIAVAEAARGRGVGARILRAVERHAAKQGAARLFLLTEDAQGFFAANGYREIPRDEAPPAVVDSAQFASLCPESAAFMGKTLNA